MRNLRRSRRFQIAALAVILFSASSVFLSCVYVMRSDFAITAAQPQLSVNGWTLRPKIVSSEARQQGTPPAPSNQFTLALWATHPVPSTGPGEAVDDISVDSIRVTFPPGLKSQSFVFNEAAFISYRSVSRDSIVKRFSVVDAKTQKFVWFTFPSDANSLMLDLYVSTGSGKFAPKETGGSNLGFDSIQPVGENRTAVTLTTMVLRDDHLSSGIGLLEKKD